MRKEQSLNMLKKIQTIIFLTAILIMLVPAKAPAFSKVALSSAWTKVYLPLVQSNFFNGLPLMAGVAPEGWPDQSTVDAYMRPLDSWVSGVTGGRSTSIWATFLPINFSSDEAAKQNVEVTLTVIWNAGYTPFVNLPTLSGDSAYVVATSPKYEDIITRWARSFKQYANNGTRFAYIAPMQEMNGAWVSYGQDPVNFKLAYRRFQTIFAREGVPANSVKWVFAPNGWTDPELPMFEAYYPGDAYVDVLAMSAYNFGYCAPGSVWEEPDTVFNNPNFDGGHYLDRLRALSPSKPIFIAQTAVAPYRYTNTTNDTEKNRWLRDAYSYLAKQQNVQAVIYFNIDDTVYPKCLWPFYTPDGKKYDGYSTGINSNGFNYISPATLMKTNHTVQ